LLEKLFESSVFESIITDYRSQGQTIQPAIVDIAKPPSGSGLTLLNIHVALSRSSGRDTFHISRDFDEDVLLQALDQDSEREDARLEGLDHDTRVWWGEMPAPNLGTGSIQHIQ
jgi:hypothetical protein